MSGRGTCQQCLGSGWIPHPDGTRQLCPGCGRAPQPPDGPSRGSFRGAVFAVVGVVLGVAVLSNAGGWLEPVLNPSAANNPSRFFDTPVDRRIVQDPDAERVREVFEHEMDCGDHGRVLVSIDASFDAETDTTRGARRPANADVRFTRDGQQLGAVEMQGWAQDTTLSFGASAEAGEGPRDLVPMQLLVVDDEERPVRMNNSKCDTYLTPRGD